MVDLYLSQIKMNLYKTICELEVSTKSDSCHYLGSGTFDFTLSQHLSFENKHKVFIGARNVKWAEKIRNLRFLICLTKKSSEFDRKELKQHSIGYRNYEEFSDLIQSYGNQSLDANPNTCMNFSGGSEKHTCIDATILPFKVVLKYRNNRFMMDIHHDLMLVVSENVASILDFEGGEKIAGDLIVFKKNAYISSDYKYFTYTKKNRMALVVHDIIKEYFVASNGNCFSVLFDYDCEQIYRRNEILGVKELVKRDQFKQFRFCILDETMNSFADDVRSRDLSFILVFFTF